MVFARRISPKDLHCHKGPTMQPCTIMRLAEKTEQARSAYASVDKVRGDTLLSMESWYSSD